MSLSESLVSGNTPVMIRNDLALTVCALNKIRQSCHAVVV